MTLGVNDYPWAGSSNLGGFDTWGYAIRECASFCAWRLSNDLGVTPVPRWGNAYRWTANAAAAGVAVDSSPAVGSILALLPGHNGASLDGHVALVLEVGPSAHAPAGSVYVEDYNYGTPFQYNRHTIPVSGSMFIHVGTGSASAGSSPATLTAALTSANTGTLAASSTSSGPLGVLGTVGNVLSGAIFVWGGEVVIGALMLIAGLWLTAGRPGSQVIQAAGVPLTEGAVAGKVAAGRTNRKRATATRERAQERAQERDATESRRALQRATRPRRRSYDAVPRPPRVSSSQESAFRMGELRTQGRARDAAYRRRVQSQAREVPF